MNCTTLIGIAAFSLSLLLPSQGTSGEIYILHMKNGRNMKCRSVRAIGNSILCDADGLDITVDRSTVDAMSKSKGQLTKRSPRSRTIAGEASVQARSQKIADTRCAEILDELKAINDKINSMSLGEMYTSGARKNALTNEYELRCMSASARQGRQQDREIGQINRKLNQIHRKQQEMQNAQRGFGY